MSKTEFVQAPHEGKDGGASPSSDASQSMSTLDDAISQIEKHLADLDRNVLIAKLRPGLQAVEIAARLQQAGLPNSRGVESLYSWRDGTQTTGVTLDDIHLFPGFYLLSLHDAILNYLTFVDDPRWRPGWLPVFANGGGDFYIVDLSGELFDPVRHFRIEEPDQPVEFQTLQDMLVTLAAAYVRGVFFMDGDGYLEMDDPAFEAIAAALNPNVAWWNL